MRVSISGELLPLGDLRFFGVQRNQRVSLPFERHSERRGWSSLLRVHGLADIQSSGHESLGVFLCRT